jgi:tetratricopeptide (TPR) repeat protein
MQRTAAPPPPTSTPLATLERALNLLANKDFAAAEPLLAGLAGDRDEPELGARARVYLAVCRTRLEEAARANEDPYLLAVVAKNEGELDRALELCRQNGNDRDERFIYLAASIHALRGDESAAAEALAHAIALQPKNRVHAFHDSDFAALRGRPPLSDLLRVG